MKQALARLAVALMLASLDCRAAEEGSSEQVEPSEADHVTLHATRPTGREPPLSNSSTNLGWEWELHALVQVDWIVMRQSSVDATDTTNGQALNDQRFLLRRGRTRLQGQRSYLGAWLELDVNTTDGVRVDPFEAGVSGGWPTSFAAQRAQVSGGSDLAKDSARPEHVPSVSLAAGLLRVPFGFESQEPLTRRPWLERARFATAFFGQARDLGAALSAAYDVARLEVGITNGSPLGTGQYSLTDADAGKDWVGRLGVDWRPVSSLRLEAGWSWLTGSALSPGSAATKDSVVWVDDNENGLVEVVELSPAPGVPAVPSAPFKHNAVGADLRLTWAPAEWGELQVRGEVVRAINLDRALEPADPIRLGRNVRQLGYVLGARYELYHLLWIALRRDVYDPDADATRQEVAALVPADRSYRSWSICIGARVWGARLMGQYDLEDNALGRDEVGRPTTLRDDRLTARAEIAFP